MRATEGDIPNEAQVNVKPALTETNHFLPCKCIPVMNMTLEDASDDLLYLKCRISSKNLLTHDICELAISLPYEVKYQTGQFINIRRFEKKQTARSYSIVYPYDKSNNIIIHVKKVENGVFSQWLFNQAEKDDLIQVNLPLGDACHSLNINVKQKIIVCTGSGLGVAVGLASEALASAFTGNVTVIHQCKNNESFYEFDLLNSLQNKYDQFSYKKIASTGVTEILSVLESVCLDSKSVELYQYGNPRVVSAVKAHASKMGVCDTDIYCDPFEHSHTLDDLQNRIDDMQFIEEQPRTETIDIELWQALGNGQLLKTILDHFYTRVLKDDILSAFFEGVTKDHIVGKQYAFMSQYLTGKDVYFGDRPRNAHHLMVISHETFNHREKLFSNSCIQCGLATDARIKLLEINESYRGMIVKSKIWPRVTNGVVKPLKGFETLTLDIGTVCDDCGHLLEAGDDVQYHGLLGQVYCIKCTPG